jgi:hypothetical protein
MVGGESRYRGKRGPPKSIRHEGGLLLRYTATGKTPSLSKMPKRLATNLWSFSGRVPKGDKNATENIFGSYRLRSSGNGIAQQFHASMVEADRALLTPMGLADLYPVTSTLYPVTNDRRGFSRQEAALNDDRGLLARRQAIQNFFEIVHSQACRSTGA